MFDEDLCTFTTGADTTIYIAVDERVVSVLPEWLSDWTKTEDTLTASSDLTFVLYKKNFKSGEKVTLGKNGGNGNNTNYLIFAKNIEVVLNGKLIKNLQVFDSENAIDWSIQSNFANDTKLFGDRDLTCTSIPSIFEGAEYVRTACDSKLFTADLAEMTAGADMTLMVAIDTRVVPLPTWLNDWTDTNTSISTSNDLTMKVYSKSMKSGEKITLGTDGGLVESVNYVVFAKEGTIAVRGDVNMDGKFNAADLVLLQKWLLAVPDTKLANWKAGDLCEDGQLDVFDMVEMRKLLIQK